MPSQAEYDAAFAAAMPLVRAEVTDEMTQIPVFVRPKAEAQITAHWTQIEAVVRGITNAAVDAAAQARQNAVPASPKAPGV
jgi:hypothetical protein